MNFLQAMISLNGRSWPVFSYGDEENARTCAGVFDDHCSEQDIFVFYKPELTAYPKISKQVMQNGQRC